MKLSFLSLLFILSLPAAAQTRIEKEIHPMRDEVWKTTTYTNIGNGREKVEVIEYLSYPQTPAVVIRYETLHGKIDGRHEYYSTPKALLEFHTYARGKVHGPFKRYYHNGQVQYEGEYVNEQQHGEYVSYHFNGKLKSKGRYVAGKEDGFWVYYQENGHPLSKGSYKNGLKEGLWETYFTNGSLESEKRYIKGEVDPSFVSTKSITKPCPDLKRLRGFCILVMKPDMTAEYQGKTLPRYKAALLDAACVDLGKDTEAEVARKIAALLKQQEDIFRCNNFDFIGYGNIFKQAVLHKSWGFLQDMLEWKVDFNKVDEGDGKTVLDFMKKQMETSNDYHLRNYYNLIKEAGGKHASEL